MGRNKKADEAMEGMQTPPDRPTVEEQTKRIDELFERVKALEKLHPGGA